MRPELPERLAKICGQEYPELERVNADRKFSFNVPVRKARHFEGAKVTALRIAEELSKRSETLMESSNCERPHRRDLPRSYSIFDQRDVATQS